MEFLLSCYSGECNELPELWDQRNYAIVTCQQSASRSWLIIAVEIVTILQIVRIVIQQQKTIINYFFLDWISTTKLRERSKCSVIRKKKYKKIFKKEKENENLKILFRPRKNFFETRF